MAKKRASVKHAETHLALERSFERKARDFAYEAGLTLHIGGREVSLEREGQSKFVCFVEHETQLWRIVWRAMCAHFPALSRYVH